MRKFVAYFVVAFSLLIIYGSIAFSIITHVEYEINTTLILSSLFLNLLIMFLPAILFVYLVYGRVWHELYFRKEGAIKSTIYGISFSLLFILLTSLIIWISGYNEANPLAEEIRKNMNLPLLFLIPFLSALTEETYFRGLIQMQMERKGNALVAIVVSSLLFSLAHLEYGTYIQIIMPFMFGIVLGILMHFCKNVMAPISAHFMYNFISLTISACS